MARSARGARNLRGAVLSACALAAAPCVSHADVSSQERVELGGAMGALVKMGIDTSTSISGDRARMDTKVTCGNALMRMFCPGDTAQIIRLDKDTTWQLDLEKKTWYEESFEDFRRRQAHAAEQMKKAQAAQAQEPAADEQRCEVQPATSDVRRTGEKATFAGHQAERTTITVTQACKDRETGEVCETRWTADQWLASSDAGQDEQQRFWRAYAKKLLRDEVAARTAAAQALAYMESHRASFGELAKRLAEQQGTPLKSTLALAVGGPGCRQAAQTAATDGATAEKPSLGGAIAGALGGSLGGALFKRAKKKEAESAPAAESPTAAPAGFATLFEMTTEVKGFDRAPVPADRFEIPAGFTKVDPPSVPTE